MTTLWQSTIASGRLRKRPDFFMGWRSASQYCLVAVLACVLFPSCDAKLESVSSSPANPVANAEDASSTDSAGWPNLYGPGHKNFSNEKNIVTTWPASGPSVKWTRDTGHGYSAAVAFDDKVVMLFRRDDEEIVECLDAESGELNWEYRYPTGFTCSFEYSNGPYSTPILTAEYAITVGAEGLFHCFDIENGDLIWKRQLLTEYGVKLKEWPVAASPILFEDRLIFNLGAVEQNAGIVALDTSDGSTIWEATDHDFSHATPCQARFHGKGFVFVFTDQGLVSLDPHDGTVYWEIAHRIRQTDRYNAVSPVVHDDHVCIITGPSVKPGIRCFRILPDGSYQEPWKNFRLLNSQYTNPAVAAGYLYGFTPMKQGGPELKCIDLKQGKLAWKFRPDVGRGNLLAVDGSLIILGEDGVLCSMSTDPSEPTVLCRTEQPILEGPCYTSLTLSNGLLYARNEKEIVCLDLRSR